MPIAVVPVCCGPSTSDSAIVCVRNYVPTTREEKAAVNAASLALVEKYRQTLVYHPVITPPDGLCFYWAALMSSRVLGGEVSEPQLYSFRELVGESVLGQWALFGRVVEECVVAAVLGKSGNHGIRGSFPTYVADKTPPPLEVIKAAYKEEMMTAHVGPLGPWWATEADKKVSAMLLKHDILVVGDMGLSSIRLYTEEDPTPVAPDSEVPIMFSGCKDSRADLPVLYKRWGANSPAIIEHSADHFSATVSTRRVLLATILDKELPGFQVSTARRQPSILLAEKKTVKRLKGAE